MYAHRLLDAMVAQCQKLPGLGDLCKFNEDEDGQVDKKKRTTDILLQRLAELAAKIPADDRDQQNYESDREQKEAILAPGLQGHATQCDDKSMNVQDTELDSASDKSSVSDASSEVHESTPDAKPADAVVSGTMTGASESSDSSDSETDSTNESDVATQAKQLVTVGADVNQSSLTSCALDYVESQSVQSEESDLPDELFCQDEV
jgi:hypothetical protein